MLEYREFTAWLEIDGTPAEEYGIEVDEVALSGPTVSCWVASQVDKTFTIHYRLKDSARTLGQDFVFDSYVDGHGQGQACKRERLKPESLKCVGVKTSADTMHPFKFSRLQTTEEEDIAPSATTARLGEIEVAALLITTTGQTRLATFGQDIPGTQVVNERSKKAVDQQVGLGAAMKSENTSNTYLVVNRIGSPWARFIFKYRTLDMLIANDIAPAPPPVATSSSSSSTKRTRNADSEDVKPIIIDISDDEDEGPRAPARHIKKQRVKKECGTKPTVASGATIDLTEDD